MNNSIKMNDDFNFVINAAFRNELKIEDQEDVFNFIVGNIDYINNKTLTVIINDCTSVIPLDDEIDINKNKARAKELAMIELEKRGYDKKGYNLKNHEYEGSYSPKKNLRLSKKGIKALEAIFVNAVEYSLGRNTYAPSVVCEVIEDNLDLISEECKEDIVALINNYFVKYKSAYYNDGGERDFRKLIDVIKIENERIVN